MRIEFTELAEEQGVIPKGETLGFANQIEKQSRGFLEATVFVKASGEETVVFAEKNGKVHEIIRM